MTQTTATIPTASAQPSTYDGMRLHDPDWVDEVSREISGFAASVRGELREAARACRFPREIYREMGRRGWIGPLTPQAEGGLGGGVREYCVIGEEVARWGLVTGQISSQGQRWLLDWGTDEQRREFLGPMARGEVVFSESISEPGVGSSLKAMRATARRDGDDWILNGAKTHVNLGHEADVTLFYAIADEGLSAFLVKMRTPGITSRQTDPIGLRLIPTADVVFDDVRVPARAVLHEPGRGMDTFFGTFNVSRLGNASELIGFGRRALALAVAYASGRKVGDHVVTNFQGIQWAVADRVADLYAAALTRNLAAAAADDGMDTSLRTSLAKKLAIEAADRAVNEVFALIGGHGLYNDTEFSQLLCDVKVLRTAGGSLEVLRNFVARQVLRSDAVGLL